MRVLSEGSGASVAHLHGVSEGEVLQFEMPIAVSPEFWSLCMCGWKLNDLSVGIGRKAGIVRSVLRRPRPRVPVSK